MWFLYFIQLLKQVFGNSLLEWIGVFTALIGIWLTARLHIICWIFSMISSIIYAYVFYKSTLYADFILQFFFIALSIWGWIHWGKSSLHNSPPIKSLLLVEWFFGLSILAVFTFLFSFLLMKYTNDSLPILDSLCFSLSIWATYLTTKFKLDNWIIWLIANLIYILIYIKKGLIPTTILYGVLCMLSIMGYFKWVQIKSSLKELKS